MLPLLDAFDLTPVFAALIDFLDSLKGELGDGLDEVNTAYQSLIALRPGRRRVRAASEPDAMTHGLRPRAAPTHRARQRRRRTSA